MQLILVRHGESIWNKENRFTGWTDVELSSKGIEEAKEAGYILKKHGIKIEKAYTSRLKRAKDTLMYMCETSSSSPVIIEDYRLNERHYGALQGLNKDETRAKYGDEQVKLWRRSFDVRPPELSFDDERFPGFDPKYKEIPVEKLPRAESLKDTLVRVKDFWDEIVAKERKYDDEFDEWDATKIVIVAHGNSLRALIKELENISDRDIVELEIPTGKPILYELDCKLNVARKEYLK